MAESSEPRTETLRINLPPPAPMPADQNIKQTVRIQVPVRENLSKPVPGSMEPIPPLDQIKKPFVAPPAFAPQPSIDDSAPAEKKKLLWWILFILSAMILIIQIWTYFS
jgi:hypothetical protein